MTPEQQSAAVRQIVGWWREQAAEMCAKGEREGVPAILWLDAMLLAATQMQAEARGLTGTADHLEIMTRQLQEWAALVPRPSAQHYQH